MASPFLTRIFYIGKKSRECLQRRSIRKTRIFFDGGVQWVGGVGIASVIGVIFKRDDRHAAGLVFCNLPALGAGGGKLPELLTVRGDPLAGFVCDEHTALRLYGVHCGPRQVEADIHPSVDYLERLQFIPYFYQGGALILPLFKRY